MNHTPTLSLPRAVLFDMDGTLTKPMLDFLRIKTEMGIGNAPILESLAQMDEDRRKIAQAILDRHEHIAATQSTLNAGCENLLDWLGHKGIAIALITRNSRRNTTTVLNRHGLEIEVTVTRDDGLFKPDPAPLLLACRRLEIDPAHAWMVGDGWYDIQAGNAAGIRTVWISHGQDRPFADEPWKAVRDLAELADLLQSLCG